MTIEAVEMTRDEMIEVTNRAWGTFAYLKGQHSDAIPYKLKFPTEAELHEGCIVEHDTLPVGTSGWLFTSNKIHYSAYTRVDDMDLPAPGADIFQSGAYYTFLTFVEREGRKVVATAFKSVDYAPRVIGKL